MKPSVLVALAAMVLACALTADSTAIAKDSKHTTLGVALSPAHFPYFSHQDIENFFTEASQMGSHVTWICEWQSVPPLVQIQAIHNRAAQNGLKFHLYLSPIALMGGRKTPAVPASAGGTSFKDPAVRQAYKDEVLTFASLVPEYLGLATEVNFLAQNPAEFEALVTLARETYLAVKQKYPAQTVTISFQWDVMSKHQQFDILKQFAGSLDVYSFTTYPDAFGYPVKIPADYFSSVRNVLPRERLGFSEIGWSAAPPSSQDEQADFFRKLPQLMSGARPEFLTLALLHDVSMFTGELARLNAVGIRQVDDTPKKAWVVVVNLPELR